MNGTSVSAWRERTRWNSSAPSTAAAQSASRSPAMRRPANHTSATLALPQAAAKPSASGACSPPSANSARRQPGTSGGA